MSKLQKSMANSRMPTFIGLQFFGPNLFALRFDLEAAKWIS